MKYRVYISPSVQEANPYAGGLGTEEQWMQTIGREVVRLLKYQGTFEVFANSPEMSLVQIVHESNELAVDAHVAIHSNAGGGRGTEVWYYQGSIQGKKLAEYVYNRVVPLSPGVDRGIKASAKLYELKNTKASACIAEIAFHDNPEEARWITEHVREIAEAIAAGVCDFFGVRFKPPKDETKLPPEVTTAKLFINGQEVPGRTIVINGRSFIWPGVLKRFGAKVEWRGGTIYIELPRP
jgi:N-acetylmuramoyl-L-alanine amidase